MNPKTIENGRCALCRTPVSAHWNYCTFCGNPLRSKEVIAGGKSTTTFPNPSELPLDPPTITGTEETKDVNQ